MNDRNVSSWLDKLQQESWNLELLISGFSIFLLLQVGEPLTQFSIQFYELSGSAWEAGMFAIFLSTLKAASYVMIINLLVHVVSRGVWVGMVGLRSVGKYFGSPTVAEESHQKLLNCLSQFYRVYIDTIALDDQRYYFEQHPNNAEKGLTTMIRLDSFPPGAHYININTKHLVADTIQEKKYARILFWKE